MDHYTILSKAVDLDSWRIYWSWRDKPDLLLCHRDEPHDGFDDFVDPDNWSGWPVMSEAEKLNRLFYYFHRFVIVEGIDPHLVHAQLMKLREFRCKVWPGIPASEDRP